jgi:uncharacterized delta-60 repeat protein
MEETNLIERIVKIHKPVSEQLQRSTDLRKVRETVRVKIRATRNHNGRPIDVRRTWFSRNTFVVVAALAALVATANSSAFAQPPTLNFALARYNTSGSVDTSFGSGGGVLTDFVSSTGESASGVAIDGRGRIVVAGSASINGEWEFALARYTSDGALDTTFGGGDGKVVTDFISSLREEAHAVVIDARGRIVVVGKAYIPGYGNEFALARYNSDGTRDTTFGSGDGKVVTNFLTSTDEEANAVAIDSNGKIVVAGTAYVDTNNDTYGDTYEFALARYNSDGTRDTTFGGGDGKVVTHFASSWNEWAYALAIDASGRIVVAGSADFSDYGYDPVWNPILQYRRFALARYNSDGHLDTSFGDRTGMVVTEFSSSADEYIRALALDASGRIVVAGGAWIPGGSYQFALARYLSDGALDPSFSGDGKRVTDFTSSSTETANAIAITSSGKILAAGVANVGGNGLQFAMARYNSDGSLDGNFNGSGKVVTNFCPTSDEGALALAIDANGKIVLAGFAY